MQLSLLLLACSADALMSVDKPSYRSMEAESKKKGVIAHAVASPTAFPLYAVSADYKNPLDTNGRRLENLVVNDVTTEKLWTYLEGLTDNAAGGLQTRSFANPKASEAMVSWLVKSFSDMGFDRVCVQNFQTSLSWQHMAERGAGKLWKPNTVFNFSNVVAFVDGPNTGSVTVGAHYDSRPYGMDEKAPGAVDNGSGLATVLALARAFKKQHVSPQKPVYFTAFSGEEMGMLGSDVFAESLHGDPDKMPAACRSTMKARGPIWTGDDQKAREGYSTPLHEGLIMDETGWSSGRQIQDTVNFETYDKAAFVMDHLAASSLQHNGHNLTLIHSGKPFGSDHMSWLSRQMPAVLSLQADDEAYPFYHTSGDTIDQVSPTLLTKIAKMNAGALIRMAGVRVP